MYLPRNGREYLRITLADAPESATVEISFDDGATWKPTTGTGNERRILIAGPDFPEPLDGAIVVADKTRPSIRFTDTPEVVIRASLEYIRLD
ncbi:MAG: hypothetical protein ACRDT9_11185 [Agromyces sp.]